MKGWWGYVVTFVLGAALCGGAVLWFAHGSGTRLNDELSAVRTALADAKASNTKLAESNRQLSGELATADRLVKKDGIELARRQRIIDGQQRDLDQLKRGIADIAGQISNGLGDIRSSAQAIADGFERLYRIYHTSPG
jgi:uncharacterized protein HemX